MIFRPRWLLFVACVTAFATTASSQQATSVPAVVLSRIHVSYPPIAESARVSGKVNVRVRVRPDGTVAESTLLEGLPLLSNAAVDAASRASFECRECTEPSTSHTIAFVFSFDGLDSDGNPRPPAWKQTGDASSEVTVFGHVPILYVGPPSKPFHVRAARCAIESAAGVRRPNGVR
jgi:TonB family protein